MIALLLTEIIEEVPEFQSIMDLVHWFLKWVLPKRTYETFCCRVLDEHAFEWNDAIIPETELMKPVYRGSAFILVRKTTCCGLAREVWLDEIRPCPCCKPEWK